MVSGTVEQRNGASCSREHELKGAGIVLISALISHTLRG